MATPGRASGDSHDPYARVTRFFADFKTKDWLSCAASTAALTLSLVSFLQKQNETAQARRKQLTDVLETLSDLNTEIQKFKSLKDKDGYPENYPALLDDQRRFLVRQASYISARIKRLVSPYEYLVMADVFDGINDVDEAERYYKIACTAWHAFDRGVAFRRYGFFLFAQERQPEAHEAFQKAIQAFAGRTDRHKGYRASVYERWAAQEQDWSNTAEAIRLLKCALDEFKSIAYPARRNFEVSRVTKKLDSLTLSQSVDAKS